MQAKMDSRDSNLNKCQRGKTRQMRNLQKIRRQINDDKEQQEEIENKSLELLGKIKRLNEQKTELKTQMKNFEKETRNVQKRLRKIGDTIEKANGILVDKNIMLRKSVSNKKLKTQELQKLREQYARIIGQYDFMDFIKMIDDFKFQDSRGKQEQNIVDNLV